MHKIILICGFAILVTGCATNQVEMKQQRKEVTQVEKERQYDAALSSLAHCWVQNYQKAGFGQLDSRTAAYALSGMCDKEYKETIYASSEAHLDTEETRKLYLRDALTPEAHVKLFTTRAVDIK